MAPVTDTASPTKTVVLNWPAELLSAKKVRPQAVEDGGWTSLDFAANPPCAYSTFTTCPLSPPENRLPVAIEAGLKQLPPVKGY